MELPYDLLHIDFQTILPDVFEAAITEHIAGPDNSRGWAELVKGNPQLIAIVAGIARKHRIPFADAAGFVLAGINIGYILHERQSERRVSIVDWNGR